MPKYKMVRVREDEFDLLRETQRLLRQKGLESVDWTAIGAKAVVGSLEKGSEDPELDRAVTLGNVVGAGAAALAYLILRGERNDSGETKPSPRQRRAGGGD